jgi:zinc transporter 2
MFIVAWMGLIFNIIQMKILHSGDGHYHLGGASHAHEDEHDHLHPEQKEPKTSSDEEMKRVMKNLEHNNLKEALISESQKHEESNQVHTDHHHHHHSERNINISSASLHVLGDLLMSVGVIIASVVILIEPTANIADPICTYVFSIIVCFTTTPIFKECIMVMMEGTPE